jgi:RNA polymerase sigma-70 factor (sigma-E family)
MAGASESEFVEYFTARAVSLRRLGYALCGDWHLAEDLVSTTFMQLYRHWRRARRESIDGYARRILVNAYLSHKRRRRRESVVPAVPDRAATGADPGLRVDLGRALAELAPRQRAMVVLRYLEDLPVAEVAGLLGVAEGTVKSQTARGVQALRAAMAEQMSTKECGDG